MAVPEFNVNGAAHELGSEGVDNLVENAQEVCNQEQGRIGLANEALTVRIQGHNQILLDDERAIHAMLQVAPPPGSLRRLRRRAIYYWALTILLTISGFIFVQLTFEPFHLGWKAWLYSAGIAVVTPFLVEHWLEKPGMEKVMTRITVIAAIAALTSLMIFALIRGNLFAEQLRANDASPVVVDDEPQTQAGTATTFYERTVLLLQLGMILLAFSMETAAGLALHHAWRSMPDDSEDWKQLRKQLADIRYQRCDLAHQQIMLRNEPRMFAHQFWRDFSRSMLSKAKRSANEKGAGDKLVLLIVATVAVGWAHAQKQVHADPNTVIAIDLSASVGTPGPDGKTDFEKNVEGVTRVLSHLRSGEYVTVIGIIDHSYAQPYVLLSAHVADDPGYFGERLTKARAHVIHAWRERSAHLTHGFRHTDVIGALELASDLFSQKPLVGGRRLIIFSDMRQNGEGINLECMALVPAFTAAGKRYGSLPNLDLVDSYILGVDGAGKSTAYWKSLREFWTNYLLATGSSVISYSALRDPAEDPNEVLAARPSADHDQRTRINVK